MKITHFAKIKKGKGVNYYINGYHLTDKDFKGIDSDTANYLKRLENFEVITETQYKKLTGEVKETSKNSTSKTKKAVKAKETKETKE